LPRGRPAAQPAGAPAVVLDEPTNNLDLDSVAQLVAALRLHRGALLVASQDEPFLAALALDRRTDRGPGPHPVAGADPETPDPRDF
jgi:hypothetical protein